MTSTTLRVLEPDEYTSWFGANRGALLHRSPFHQPEWLDAVSHGTKFRVRCIGVMHGRDLVAAVPGFLTRRGPLRLFGSPLRGTMTSYLGPVSLDACYSGAGIRDLLVGCATFARRRWWAPYAQFTTRDAVGERLAAAPGWHEQRPGSYRLELGVGEEVLFARLKSKCRRNVRKAAREGVVIVPFDDAAHFHRILADTFRRHGSSSWHSRRFFDAILRLREPDDLVRAWAARFDSQIIAAGLFLRDDREMHFLSGASVPGFGSLPTSYLLHWHAISEAAREGLQVFNSEASRIPSIDAFKESFNPELERRSTLIHAPGALWTARRSFVRWNRSVRALRSRARAPISSRVTRDDT
jgi:CelD/BcsL family acetyltransferase involved in cellulose biosynthesis